MDQFLVAVSMTENPEEKDLINLTFNLDHFTLVQDISNMGKIGRAYVLNTEGAVPAHDEDDPKYAAIGKDLVDRGLAQITERGLLIYNPLDELQEVYDGQTFPEYYDRVDYLISVAVSYNNRCETLLLPDEDLAIKKAVARIGAPSAEDCDVDIAFHNIDEDWVDRIQSIINAEGIYAANNLLHSLDTADMDFSKLTAVMEFAGVEKASNIAILADHIEDLGIYLRRRFYGRGRALLCGEYRRIQSE